MVAAENIRDRTSEFRQAVSSALIRTGTPSPTAAQPLPAHMPPSGSHGPPNTRPRSQFSLAAAALAKDIQRTSTKLARLTELAQRRSLFDDPTSEIQELTFAVKQDIAQLNSKVESLQQLQAKERGHLSKQAGDHTGSVLNSLQSKLMDTASEFKTVLKMRNESLQAQQNRRSQFLGEAPVIDARGQPAPSAAPPSFRSSTALNSSGSDVVLDLGGGSAGAQAASDGGIRAQEFRQQLALARPESSYYQARAEAVRQVESTIAELGQIFNQLATMVSEQGEMVDRIDSNVDDTLMNLEEGRGQLMRYYNSISSNRGLVLKMFATVFVFMIVWVLLA